jgi:hypothetical protein
VPTACGHWRHDAKRSSASEKQQDGSADATAASSRDPQGADRQPDDRQPVPAGVPAHQDYRVASGQATQAEANAIKAQALTNALPGLRSEADKTTALGMIADLAPQPTIPGYDKAQADLALAGLTPDTGDDLAALNTLKGIDTGQLNDAISKNDFAGIQQWAAS